MVYTDSMADENGNVVSQAAYGIEDDYPPATEIIVILEDVNGRTRMVMTHSGVPANEQGAAVAWGQIFDKMITVIDAVRTTQAE